MSGITRNGLPALADFQSGSGSVLLSSLGSLKRGEGDVSVVAGAGGRSEMQTRESNVAANLWSGTTSRVAEGLAGKWRVEAALPLTLWSCGGPVARRV